MVDTELQQELQQSDIIAKHFVLFNRILKRDGWEEGVKIREIVLGSFIYIYKMAHAKCIS